MLASHITMCKSALLLTPLLLLVLLLPTPVHAVVLKIATVSPDGSFWMEKMRAGAKEVEQRTNKRVRFKFYPGGVMGDAKTVLRKMRVGQLQGGAFTSGNLFALYPDSQVYSLLLRFRSQKEVDYVRQHMDGVLKQGLAERGLVAFGLSEIGFAYVMSTRPVHGLDDVRRQKTWVPDNDANALEVVKTFSITPIPLPFGDVLVGLQSGLVETVAASPMGAIALQWHTQIKYVSDLPLLYIYGILAVDKKAFGKISPADQQIVLEVMGKTVREIDAQSRRDNKAALAALKQQGIKFLPPSAASLTEIKRLTDKTIANNIAEGKLSRSLYERQEKLLRDYRAAHSAGQE
jgi:TRAP-type C4-dicarboxylate transport system substrate-binding protein